MVRQLDHLNLDVLDLDATTRWYGEVFGFEVVEEGVRDDGVPWRILRAGEALLCVYPRLLERPKRPGLQHLALRVEDFDATVDRLSGLGVPFGYGGGVHRYPHSRSVYVEDPSGWEIEVVGWDDDRIAFG